MSDKLTLWDIDDALHSLLLMREAEEITDEERAAIDGQIRVWCDAQVTKVDGIRGYLKHAKMMEEAATAEAASLRAKAATWEARAKRLKEFVLAIMEQRGVKRLEGRTGQLRIQANGGKRALRITREDLVPPEYKRYHVVMTEPEYATFNTLLAKAASLGVSAARDFLFRDIKEMTDEAAVRRVLESKCEACGGSGKVSADPSAVGEEEDRWIVTTYPCSACGGTGHQFVPGAELEERGSHLRVE